MPGFEHTMCDYITSNKQGAVFFTRYETGGHHLYQLGENGSVKQITKQVFSMEGIAVGADGKILVATFDVQPETGHAYSTIRSVDANGNTSVYFKRPQEFPMVEGIAVSQATGSVYLASRLLIIQRVDSNGKAHLTGKSLSWTTSRLAISPDQSLLYFRSGESTEIGCFQIEADGSLVKGQWYFKLQKPADYSSGRSRGMCVDTNGWLYVATSLGIQVCDQAGRVNFIIPTPQQPHDVCFGGKDLSELFIACGDRIYKRQTKAHGYISGQMAPIKPPPPKL
jgi:sugar lactone lactonase YvrE